MERNIVHLDLDSFFVSVEQLKNPKLRNIPLAVGGSGDRAVVAACSYEARRFGVHSAMPMKIAKRLCPQLTIIGGDYESYAQHSKIVTDIIAEKTPLYEKASIDEFYVDMTGMETHFGCLKYSTELRQFIMKNTGLPISFGMASNKMVSKVATNEAKPNGQLQIPYGNERMFLNPMAVQKLPGVGAKTSQLLYKMGVERIKTLAEIPDAYMLNMFGKSGIDLSRRAKGVDETPVIPYSEQKSISTENTFTQDTIDMAFLHSELVRMTEKIGFELRDKGYLTGCITVKLRYANFDTVTKQCAIPHNNCDHVLLEVSKDLFKKLYDRRLLVRLVGIRFTNLVQGTYQVNLFEDKQEMINLYQSIDHIKKRFGPDLITRAVTLLKHR
jgi:DNA polymerase-4